MSERKQPKDACGSKGGNVSKQTLKPLIKWPGGKSSEISKIEDIIPSFDRYIEPFFGGGALFFYLNPERSAINDISSSLMQFYFLLKSGDEELREYLIQFDCLMDEISAKLQEAEMEIESVFTEYQQETSDAQLRKRLTPIVEDTTRCVSCVKNCSLILDEAEFVSVLLKSVVDKYKRTAKNHSARPFSRKDLISNLGTGFYSGLYLYFRGLYNDFELKRRKPPSRAFSTGVFIFVREYCYGSMFRFNRAGEFNIPYGGMSYNDKRMKPKIERMFSREVKDLFAKTDISCDDFEVFLDACNLTSRDFLFLDPPYDTDFSEYDRNPFTKSDQARLADYLVKTPADFILIIKNTDFIYDLYNREEFEIGSFENTYSYNVRSRNERSAEHLVIRNARKF